MHTYTIHLKKQQHDWLSNQLENHAYIDASAVMESAITLLQEKRAREKNQTIIEQQNLKNMAYVGNLSLFDKKA